MILTEQFSWLKIFCMLLENYASFIVVFFPSCKFLALSVAAKQVSAFSMWKKEFILPVGLFSPLFLYPHMGRPLWYKISVTKTFQPFTKGIRANIVRCFLQYKKVRIDLGSIPKECLQSYKELSQSLDIFGVVHVHVCAQHRRAGVSVGRVNWKKFRPRAQGQQ